MPDLYTKPKLTYFIIASCVTVFLFQIAYSLQYGFFDENFNAAFSNLLNDYGFSLQNLLGNRVWTLLTSVFLHADPSHLILNMLALFFFGRAVEMSMGRKKFILVFLASSIAGNLAFLVSSFFIGSLGSVVIGASGAVFGLMGAAMLVRPLEFILYPYLIPIPLILVAVLYTLYNIASFLMVAANIQESNVSYISHIGGLAVGMLFGFREEKSKKGFIILLIILALLLLTPLLSILFGYLEIFNYIAAISGLVK
ncbi:MAG: rhomboid family intramembrane serine protease [Candidatus Aenigmatarchaeota archaeon]